MRQGFTLVEIIIVMALLALLASVGYAVSFTYLRTQHLRNAAGLIVSETRRAQTEAYTQSDDSAHGVKVFQDHIVRFQGDTYATRIVSEDETSPFPVSISLSGTDEIVFSSGQLGLPAATNTTIDNGEVEITITVSPYGIITLTEGPVGN